jgi:hypothetical protein
MTKQKPVCVTGIWLRTEGDKIIVEAEIGGEWIPIITDYLASSEAVISHIVEPLGMLAAKAKYQGQPRWADQATERTE